MPHVEKTVFISYRRDNAGWALAVFQDLTARGYDVFFDFTGLASGDFESGLLENVRTRAHFLVLLTASALDRCDDPSDWLRREIETAIATERNIVPLMFEGFDFGAPGIAARLTEGLKPLSRYQGLRVHADYFAEAMNRLCSKFLSVELASVAHPATAQAQSIARREQTVASAAPAVGDHELTAQEYFERGKQSTDLNLKVHCYTEAIRLKPDFVKPINNRGLALFALGDVEGALKDMDEAIRLEPNAALPYGNRGYIRVMTGEFELALKDLDEALRREPAFVEALNNRGTAHKGLGEHFAAFQDYTEAIRLAPHYAIAFYNRGGLRVEQKDFKGGLEDLDVAIRLRPNYARAFHARGEAREKCGDSAGALQDYEQALRLQPGYEEAVKSRDVLIQQRKNDEGLSSSDSS